MVFHTNASDAALKAINIHTKIENDRLRGTVVFGFDFRMFVFCGSCVYFFYSRATSMICLQSAYVNVFFVRFFVMWKTRFLLPDV
jgi:hypothetical protein